MALIVPYQLEDYLLHDYDLFAIEGLPNLFRGPKPPLLKSKENIAFFGTAHTFGSLCRYPYASILSSMLDSFAVNMAAPGASPDWYRRHQRAIEVANASKCVVVQVLPARNSSNRLLTNEPNLTGVRFREAPQQSGQHAFEVYKSILELVPDEINEIVEETRSNYVGGMLDLAAKLSVPKVLFYFSDKGPDKSTEFTSVRGLFGGFPQLVNRKCLDQIMPAFDLYVEVVSNVGFPAPFKSRFSGEQISVKRPDGIHKNNNYYPSQAMHVLAAQKLYSEIPALLNGLKG